MSFDNTNRNESVQSPKIFSIQERVDTRTVHLQIQATPSTEYHVSPLLFGKFCEHLGNNIYGGMEAQLLINPTFGKWGFKGARESVDGGIDLEFDRDKIRDHIREFASEYGYTAGNTLADDHFSGGAFGWVKSGPSESVNLSPDVGPHGGRAQRVETLGGQCGVSQRCTLQTCNVDEYEYRIVARSMRPCILVLQVQGDGGEPSSVTMNVGTNWQTFNGLIRVPLVGAKDNPLYTVSLLTASASNVVLSRALLYPADHIDHCDRAVVEMLKESHLPLLRWPGGNFVSGYDWKDGIGPVDMRPTRINPAWGGLEYNLFGTAEFVRFCRNVGCEPMICVNAGDGTAEEAAAWLQYCNGGADTPGGKLRSSHGFPDPFKIAYWEIGNEIWGKWQISWTTPQGNVDRYKQFLAKMHAEDSSVNFIACGFPWWKNNEWDDALIEGAGPALRSITDHILTGGHVGPTTNPADLYHAFLGQSLDLESRYNLIKEKMIANGQPNPKIAITELQLFSHFESQDEPTADDLLRREDMPHPGTITEALYFATLMHGCLRTQGLVEMITHSATVNHGGGLRKSKERVWANPVHHAHAMGYALVNGVPLKVSFTGPTITTGVDFENMPRVVSAPVVDAVAVKHRESNTVVLSLVNRQYGGESVTVEIGCDNVSTDATAIYTTLSGNAMSAQNTYDDPNAIEPIIENIAFSDGFTIVIPPFTYATLEIKMA